MPPSGYTDRQAVAVTQFLRACAEDLEDEARRLEKTLPDALAAEVSQIKGVLAMGFEDRYAASILALTQNFYEGLIQKAPRDSEEFDRAVESVLAVVRQQILDVHIPIFA